MLLLWDAVKGMPMPEPGNESHPLLMYLDLWNVALILIGVTLALLAMPR
jgi:hypothetical protein